MLWKDRKMTMMNDNGLIMIAHYYLFFIYLTHTQIFLSKLFIICVLKLNERS